MAPNRVDWIRRVQVEKTQRHPKGFTVYKLSSVVFPSNAPEALTKISIWKRYNDFKKLHVQIKEQCKALKNQPSPPDISKGTFFNRFDKAVIAERVKDAQKFLDFIVERKALFLSDVFQRFFEHSYKIQEIPMGQSSVSSIDNSDHADWKWSVDSIDQREGSYDSLSFQSESSEDGSFAASDTTESAGSVQSPLHSNNNAVSPTLVIDELLNNNSRTKSTFLLTSGNRHNYSLEVEDPAGSEPKPFAVPPPEIDAEVVCGSEYPIASPRGWLTAAPPEERLSVYRVVGVRDPVLLVKHRICPSKCLVLKVLRKSSWPICSPKSIGPPRPVPHMVELFEYIETDDAVFLVMEYAPRGLLFDHVKKMQDRRTAPNFVQILPDVDVAVAADDEVDVLVAQAQKLLASVSRTLEQSNSTKHQVQEQESPSGVRAGHKPRSASVIPRHRLERRFSSDDVSGHRPRTAHGSLDRGLHWSRLPETTVRDWVADLVACIDTLHSRDVIWRDLYSGNLLVGEGGRLLVSFQYHWPDVDLPLHPCAVKDFFVAPEARTFVFAVTTAADWWSVGVILYELLTGMALSAVHPCGIGSHTALELPDFLSAEAKSVLTELLQFEPGERLGGGLNGAEDIRCHPFFTGVDWDVIYKLEKDI